MNVYLLKIFRILPIVTLTFTVLVFCVTVYIDSTSSSFVVFIFMSVEVYVNWIAICHISHSNVDPLVSRVTDSVQHKNSVILDLNLRNASVAYVQSHYNHRCLGTANKSNTNQGISSQNVDIRKIWYCSKCLTNTPFNCHHCPICDRCVINRDHHCLFLGACICLKNMGHFIIFCMYIGLVSLYVDIRLYPLLFEHFQSQGKATMSLWHLISCYFFPIAFGRWLSGHENLLFLSLIAMFDVLVSTSVFTFGFGIHHLYLALTGQSQIRINAYNEFHNSYSKLSFRDVKNNFAITFGKWGALNFIFPVVLLEKLLHMKYFQDSKYN